MPGPAMTVGNQIIAAQDATDDTTEDEEERDIRKAAAAAARVFGITELLEHIMLHLSTAEITRARQINSDFKVAIDKSSPLRRAMFLEPALERETSLFAVYPNPPTPEASDSDWESQHGADEDPATDVGSDEDPASRDDSDLFGSLPNDVDVDEELSDITVPVTIPDQDPLPLEPLIEPSHYLPVFKLHPAINACRRDDNKSLRLELPSKEWEPGMWKNMLICQPPGAELQIGGWRNFGIHSVAWSGSLLKGNTLGDLMNAAEKEGMHESLRLRVTSAALRRMRIVTSRWRGRDV